MESEGGRVPQGEESIPSAHYGSPDMDRPSSDLSQPSGLSRHQSSTLGTKPTFAHPSIPKQSIGDLMRAQGQQNLGEDLDDDEPGDDDEDEDESEEESDSDDEEDGVEEVGMDDSDDEDGDEDAEVCTVR